MSLSTNLWNKPSAGAAFGKDAIEMGLEAGRRFKRAYYSYADLSTLLLRVKFRNLRRRYYEKMWREAAANVGAEALPWRSGYTRIRKGDLSTVVYLTRINLNDVLIDKVIQDKVMTQELLLERGYPVPENLTFDLSEIDKAADFFERMGRHVVIKPASGTAGGRGVTTDITDLESMKRAARTAARYSGKVIIEKHITGGSYRLLFVGGALVDAVRRDPATVTGDGKSTIKQLVAKENRRRLSEKPVTALLPLSIDSDCRQTLSNSGLSVRSRPANGEVVVLKQAINDNAAGQNHNVRDQVHPSIIEMGENMMRDLGIELGGIDLQARNVHEPLSVTDGRVLEINSPSGIHHHYLIADPTSGVPVAERFLEYMFSNQRGVMRSGIGS